MNYLIRRYTPTGDILDETPVFKKIKYVRTTNSVGGLELQLPMNYETTDFGNNQIIEIWENGQLIEDTAYFLKKWTFEEDANENQKITLFGFDANWLLATRIVWEYAGSAGADMTDYADDMAKEIFDDAFTDGGTDRFIEYLSLQAQIGAAPSISKAFAYQNVLSVIQDIADISASEGTRLYFDMVRTGIGTFEFRTFINQRGKDHGQSSGDVRQVGKVQKNLRQQKLIVSYIDEKNDILAGGQGEETDREWVECVDADRVARGYPWNRCEAFADARNKDTTALVTAEGNRALEENAPRKVVTGYVMDTKGMQYNRDYGFGDILSVEAFGETVDCHVKSVIHTIDKDGFSKRDIFLKGEL